MREFIFASKPKTAPISRVPNRSVSHTSLPEGQAPIQRILRSSPGQGKRTISQPNDHCEQAADRVADAEEVSIVPPKFSAGRDLVVGPAQYLPGTNEGSRFLAHELAHLVPQATVSQLARQGPVIQRADPTSEQPKRIEKQTTTLWTESDLEERLKTEFALLKKELDNCSNHICRTGVEQQVFSTAGKFLFGMRMIRMVEAGHNDPNPLADPIAFISINGECPIGAEASVCSSNWQDVLDRANSLKVKEVDEGRLSGMSASSDDIAPLVEKVDKEQRENPYERWTFGPSDEKDRNKVDRIREEYKLEFPRPADVGSNVRVFLGWDSNVPP